MISARNYWLAFACCCATTLLALMGKHGTQNMYWYLMSDLNVAIWLFVAWLFDDMR